MCDEDEGLQACSDTKLFDSVAHKCRMLPAVLRHLSKDSYDEHGQLPQTKGGTVNPTIDRPAVSDEASLGEPLDDVTVAQHSRTYQRVNRAMTSSGSHGARKRWSTGR